MDKKKSAMGIVILTILVLSIAANAILVMGRINGKNEKVELRGFYQKVANGVALSATIDNEEKTYYILKQYLSSDSKDELEKGKIVKKENGTLLLEDEKGKRRLAFVDEDGFYFLDDDGETLRALPKIDNKPTYLYHEESEQ